jgi:hypothetical protein
MSGIPWDTFERRGAVEISAKMDLQAFSEATRAPFRHVVKDVSGLLGPRLAAYIVGVGETRALQQWAEGIRAPKDPDAERRLRLAAQLAKLIVAHDNGAVAQAWFQGLNPQLDDCSPARLLREGDVAEVGPKLLAAARAFVAGG